MSSGAALGGEELLAHRIIHDPGDDFAAIDEAQAHREHRKAVSEIGGPVERIDIPAIIRAGLLAAALLAHDSVPGEMGAQAIDDERLRAPVGVGHEVRGPLVRNLAGMVEELREQSARLARNLDRRIQVGLHNESSVISYQSSVVSPQSSVGTTLDAGSLLSLLKTEN